MSSGKTQGIFIANEPSDDDSDDHDHEEEDD